MIPHGPRVECACLPNHTAEAYVTRRVVGAVEDLLFKSKISETASQLGIEALALLGDVRSDAATRDVATVGFLSHVQKDLAVAAREAGCDRIVARSAFTKDLQTGKWLEWLSPPPDPHRGP